MADNLVSQPPLTVPMVDSNGTPSKAWAIWFRDLYRRTGYKGGNAIDNNLEAIEQIEGDIEELTIRVTKNEEDISSLAIRVEKNEEDILTISDRVDELEYRVYELVNTTVSVTASEYQTIICKNTNPINVTLKSEPAIGDEVNIKRAGDLVTVIGQIDGLTNIVLNVPKYSMKLVFNGTDWSEI